MNPFFGIDLATLQALKARTLESINAALINQSYSVLDKSVSRAELGRLTETLGQIQAAIEDADGTATNVTYVSFNGL